MQIFRTTVVSGVFDHQRRPSPDLPTPILIGNSIRYDQNVVEKWLFDRQQVPATADASIKTGGDDVLAPSLPRPMIFVPECPLRINPDSIRSATGINMAVPRDPLWRGCEEAARGHADAY